MYKSYVGMSRSHAQSCFELIPLSSPEAVLLLVSTKNHNLWPGPTLEVCDSLTSESSLTNLIGSGLNVLCLQSHSELESHWTYPEQWIQTLSL